ncbi:MAG: HigA family addiction module antitoxin [Magnetococcus sp. DMHC-1]|nr:HigA family addiction module antidote protein [Magnetococcales bacterium]
MNTKTIKARIPPIHPGEILKEEFMEPLGITQYHLAKCLGVPQMRISEIVRGLRSITADTAWRLGRFFSMDPGFWSNLQSHYDMEQARDQLDASGVLEREVTPFRYPPGIHPKIV